MFDRVLNKFHEIIDTSMVDKLKLVVKALNELRVLL